MPKRRPKKSKIPNARAIFKRVLEVAEEQLVEDVNEWAYVVRDEFVERIQSQAFAAFQVVFYPESGTNLSPKWLTTKEQAGADLRTMIATGHYVDSIDVFKKQDRRRKATIIRVGFHHSTKPRDLDGQTVDIEIPGTGITGLTALAIVHELGSIKANIPARPHWGPHRVRVRAQAVSKRKEFQRNIALRLKKDRRTKGLAVGVR